MRLALFSHIIVTSSHSSSSGDPRYLGLLLFLSGFVFYGAVFLRYRNTDKRHLHESETEAKMLDVRGADQHVDTRKGLKRSTMEGANNHDVRGGSGEGTETVAVRALNTALEQFPGGRNLLS